MIPTQISPIKKAFHSLFKKCSFLTVFSAYFVLLAPLTCLTHRKTRVYKDRHADHLFEAFEKIHNPKNISKSGPKEADRDSLSDYVQIRHGSIRNELDHFLQMGLEHESNMLLTEFSQINKSMNILVKETSEKAKGWFKKTTQAKGRPYKVRIDTNVQVKEIAQMHWVNKQAYEKRRAKSISKSKSAAPFLLKNESKRFKFPLLKANTNSDFNLSMVRDENCSSKINAKGLKQLSLTSSNSLFSKSYIQSSTPPILDDDDSPKECKISDIKKSKPRTADDIAVFKEPQAKPKQKQSIPTPEGLGLVRMPTSLMPEASLTVVDEPVSKAEFDRSHEKAKEKQLLLGKLSNQNTKNVEDYRKINIVWDRSILMKTLRELDLESKFKMIHGLIFRVDMALKKYIQLVKGSETILNIPRNFKHCETTRSNHFDRNNFTHEIHLEADLIIFLVAEWKDNDVLASAAPCRINKENRAYVGRLYLNLKNLNFDYGSYFEQKSEIMTVFHEVLHILAFGPALHRGLYDEVHSDKLNRKFINLMLFKNLQNDPLIDEGHWNPVYLGNDIMSPIERVDSTLSIFTLEYLDMVSSEIKTDRSVLPNNFVLDEINDFKDYFTYRCGADEPIAKYSTFCSAREAELNKHSCDRSRIYKTVCGDELLDNDCYSKEPNPKYICSNEYMADDKKQVFETYGNNSRCFNTVTRNGKNSSHCLEFEINNKGVLIKAEGSQFQCLKAGEEVTLTAVKKSKKYQIRVVCPDAREFQTLFKLTNCPYSCYGNGFCSNGKCECFDGFDPNKNCKKKTVSTSMTRFTSALF